MFRMDTGHYTQLAWAGTHLIGCGYTYYQAEDSDSHAKTGGPALPRRSLPQHAGPQARLQQALRV